MHLALRRAVDQKRKIQMGMHIYKTWDNDRIININTCFARNAVEITNTCDFLTSNPNIASKSKFTGTINNFSTKKTYRFFV